MNKSSKILLALATAVIILCTIGIVATTNSNGIQLLAIVSCLGAWVVGGTLYFIAKQRLKRQEVELLGMFFHVLTRKRHDWMNGIQIIYGYSKLNKHDRVLENIEILSEQLKKESNISKIGDPRLEWFLHEFSAKVLKFDFEIELSEQMNLTGADVDRQLLYEAVSRTVTLIEQAASCSEQEESHILTINMDTLKDSIFVSCHYDGVYDQAAVRAESEHIRRDITRRRPSVKLINECEPDHLFIEIKLPYRA